MLKLDCLQMQSLKQTLMATIHLTIGPITNEWFIIKPENV